MDFLTVFATRKRELRVLMREDKKSAFCTGVTCYVFSKSARIFGPQLLHFTVARKNCYAFRYDFFENCAVMHFATAHPKTVHF